MRIAGLPAEVGKTAASAGRSTPGNAPSTTFAVAIAAPVFPAVTNPVASLSRTRRSPTRMVESRLARTACAALSCMVMASEFALEVLFRPYQQDFHAVMTSSEEDPFQLRPGSPVRTHGVNCDDSLHCLWRMALLNVFPVNGPEPYIPCEILTLTSLCY